MAREMKDSGVEWIGEIPVNWSITKLALGLHILSGFPFDSTKFSLEKGIPLIRIRDITSGVSETKYDGDYSSEYLIKNDDILISMDGDFTVRKWHGGEAVLNQRCCKVYSDTFENRFVYYCLPLALKLINELTYSTTVKHLSVDDIKGIKIPIPLNSSDQYKIASFLDAKCAEIDKAIEATKSSIEEYKKLRQAIITEAVTKGLDPNVEMKRIDNQWIESIPNHCSFSRVGLHFNIILGKMITSNPDSKNNVLAQYVCAANVHFDGVDLSNLKQMWFSKNEIEQYAIKNGDLLVVEGGAGAGGCAIVNNIDAKIGIQNSIMIIRGSKGNDVRYLSYLLYALVNMNYIDIVCNRATIPHFTKDKLENTPYIVFQESEQIAIADYLDTRCAQIDSLIKSKEKLIEELTAYRKSLIFEYVTGKKEVPAV